MLRQKTHNIGLLVILYELLKLAKTKGDLALESHCEMPHESGYFPKEILSKKEIEFLCDHLRYLTLGMENADEIDRIIRNDIQNRFILSPFKRQRLNAIREAMWAHCSGYAPLIAVEYARKAFHYWVRPDFQEVEEDLTNGLNDFLSEKYGIDPKVRETELGLIRKKRVGQWFPLEPNDLENDYQNGVEPSMSDILSSITRIMGDKDKDEDKVKSDKQDDLDDEEALMAEWEALKESKDK